MLFTFTFHLFLQNSSHHEPKVQLYKNTTVCWAGKVVLFALSENFYECMDPTVCSLYRGTFYTMAAFRSHTHTHTHTHTRTYAQRGVLTRMQSQLYSCMAFWGIFVAKWKADCGCLYIVMHFQIHKACILSLIINLVMHVKLKINSLGWN